MDAPTTQLPPTNPAEIYDRQFVPALFRQWGDIVADAALINDGHRVLDVACGTGALTEAVCRRVGEAGVVTGLDINEQMLDVARQKSLDVDWHQGRAESLPFENNYFDAVVSQFGFMFFEDQVKALQEMFRILRPGGRLAVAVCDALDHSPGYAVLAELLQRLFGHEIAEAFRAPFSCGDATFLQSRCAAAGIPGAQIQRIDGAVEFDSITDLIATERACVWTLGGLLNESQFDHLLNAANESLKPFTTAKGKVNFTMPSLVITARKTVSH